MSGGLHSLATIIKRLEAATSRLEDLTVAQAKAQPKREEMTDDLGPSYVPPGESAPPPAPPTATQAIAETPRSVVAFDEAIIEGKVKPFVALTTSFAAPVVIQQVLRVEKSFDALRTVLLTAAACKKPDTNASSAMLMPLREDVTAVINAPAAAPKERVWANHLMTVAEGAACVGWVEIEPKPAPHIKSIKESAEFYGFKIIKEYKEKDQKHVEWVRAWLALIEELRKYVAEHHTTALAWNPKGVAFSEYTAKASSAPPAPPPPPPQVNLKINEKPTTGAGGAAAVFAQLNRGEAVTQGLRKVDPSQMTHKNPELRAGASVPAATPPKRPIKPSKPQALMGKKPGKFVLEGTKWSIEYQENEPSLVVQVSELNQVVSLYGCKSSTIHVKGKINALTIVNCTKTSVLVESVIASVSVTASPSFALQVTGSVPMIQIDSTDSGQIYLSKDCLNVEITTAKCSSINVSLPVEGEDEGVFVERAVPEMLRTTVQGSKLFTTIVEHTG